MSRTVYPSALEGIYFWNPTLGGESTEHKKILFFHPPTVELDRQKDYIGMCEGMIGFRCAYTNTLCLSFFFKLTHKT